MIRRAKATDLTQINELLDRNGLSSLHEDQIRDYCLVGEMSGVIRGVIWAAISSSGFMAWIDYFAVDYGYAGLGVRLALRGVRLIEALGVKKVVTFVEEKEDRDVAIKINERFGLRKSGSTFHLLTGETKEMVKLWVPQKKRLHKSLN